MKLLEEILEVVTIKEGKFDGSQQVAGIAIDSRKVKPGYLFIAQKGVNADGHDYVQRAIDNGAVLCLVTQDDFPNRDGILKVENEANLVGNIAAFYYDYPSEELEIVGITGTNGKTTVGTILHQSLKTLGLTCGLISTVKICIDDKEEPSELTTPDVIALQQLFARMRDAECTHVIMEVSSHAIHQNRISQVDFDIAVFTNITHDHLDYHNTFSEYIRVKKMFFDSLKPDAVAIVNIDDKNGRIMLQNTQAKQVYYGFRQSCDYKGRIIDSGLGGLQMSVNGVEAFFRLVGEFNGYNLLASFAILEQLEAGSTLEILSALSIVRAPEGRFDLIEVEKSKAFAIVDYAHTPDALENVLKTIRAVSAANVITVVGCGGDRDAKKRPIMAAIAARYSDKVVLTSDNPRSENPESILDDMEQGIELEDESRVFRISDRAQGIKMGLMLLNAGDVLLIAGKGHEKYQEINGVKHPFDDKRKVMEFSRR